MCCVGCAYNVFCCARMYAIRGYKVYDKDYICRSIWAWCDECMRVYVTVLIVDGQIEWTIGKWGYRAENGAEDRHKHKAVRQ